VREILLLAAMLFVAGCIGGDGTPQSAAAVSIVKFQPELSRVTEGDPVDLIIQVKNTGAFDARNVRAMLYMKGGFRDRSGNNEWLKDFETLRAPNAQTGAAGELNEERWLLEAPEIGPGVKTYPFRFMVDVYYDYESSAWKKVPIIKHLRIQEIQAGGGKMPASESGRQLAPIRMDINTYEPVTYRDPAGQSGIENSVEIKVLLEKVSAGYVKSEQFVPGGVECSDSLNCIDRVVLKIPDSLKFVDGYDCDFDADMSVGVLEENYEAREKAFVNLVDGNKAQLKCKVGIKEPGADEVFSLIRVESFYTYHTSGSTDIEVVKIVGR